MGGATCRTTPIPLSALEKNPMPGPLFGRHPVGEGTTPRGTNTPVHRPAKPAGSTHNSTRGLRPPEQLERQAELPSSVRRGLTLLSQLCSDPAVGVRNGRTPEVPASPRDEALFHCAKLSGVPRDALPTPQHPSPLRGTQASSLTSPAEVEGNEGFLPQPRKTSRVLLQRVFSP